MLEDARGPGRSPPVHDHSEWLVAEDDAEGAGTGAGAGPTVAGVGAGAGDPGNGTDGIEGTVGDAQGGMIEEDEGRVGEAHGGL